MSGHSKWASIKHKKGAADKKRGKIFTKITKEIIIAARDGGGDPDSNAKLRAVMLKARAANMPKDNIERAIKKGTGDLDGVDYLELNYEGYGPGGVAILIECLTDNKNRTAADVRHLLSKHGGNLGENGCVSYMFNRKGVISFDAENVSEDEIFEQALEAGADDVENSAGQITVYTDPDSFEDVLKALNDAGFEQESAEVTLVPDNYISLDNDKTAKAIKLIEILDDNDDVQNVHNNLDIPEDFDME